MRTDRQPGRLQARLARLAALALLGLAATWSAVADSDGSLAPHGGDALAAGYFRDCGRYNRLHVRIQVHHVSCGTARRIVRSYLHHEQAGGGIQRVPGFPHWKCSTGDRSGTCFKGKIGSGVPEIAFFYLKAPG